MSKMRVRYILSSVCLRSSRFSQLYVMKYMGRMRITQFSYNDFENTCTLSYHHQYQIGSMTSVNIVIYSNNIITWKGINGPL